MAKPQLGPKTRELANSVYLDQRSAGLKMIQCLQRAFEDIEGKDSKGIHPDTYKAAVELLRPFLVKPDGLAEHTFTRYCQTARKAIRYSLTWKNAVRYSLSQVREAVSLARAGDETIPFSKRINPILDAMEPQQTNTPKKKGTPPLSLAPLTNPANARKWVYAIGRIYGGKKLDELLPADEYGEAVRTFVEKCVKLTQEENSIEE